MKRKREEQESSNQPQKPCDNDNPFQLIDLPKKWTDEAEKANLKPICVIFHEKIVCLDCDFECSVSVAWKFFEHVYKIHCTNSKISIPDMIKPQNRDKPFNFSCSCCCGSIIKAPKQIAFAEFFNDCYIKHKTEDCSNSPIKNYYKKLTIAVPEQESAPDSAGQLPSKDERSEKAKKKLDADFDYDQGSQSPPEGLDYDCSGFAGDDDDCSPSNKIEEERFSSKPSKTRKIEEKALETSPNSAVGIITKTLQSLPNIFEYYKKLERWRQDFLQIFILSDIKDWERQRKLIIMKYTRKLKDVLGWGCKYELVERLSTHFDLTLMRVGEASKNSIYFPLLQSLRFIDLDFIAVDEKDCNICGSDVFKV